MISGIVACKCWRLPPYIGWNCADERMLLFFCLAWLVKSISTNLSQLSVMFLIFSLSPFWIQIPNVSTFFSPVIKKKISCGGHYSTFLLFTTDQFDVQLFHWNNIPRWRLCRLKLVVMFLKAPVTSSVHERTIH